MFSLALLLVIVLFVSKFFIQLDFISYHFSSFFFVLVLLFYILYFITFFVYSFHCLAGSSLKTHIVFLYILIFNLLYLEISVQSFLQIVQIVQIIVYFQYFEIISVFVPISTLLFLYLSINRTCSMFIFFCKFIKKM